MLRHTYKKFLGRSSFAGAPGSQGSSALGSRPVATNEREPFQLPNPIPQVRYDVGRKHYLYLYDALSKLDRDFEVKAFIVEKPDFAYDMICLVPPPTEGNDNKFDHKIADEIIPKVMVDFKNAIQNVATTRQDGKFKLQVDYYDKATLKVGFGVKNVCQEDLNETEDWVLREMLRSSLNFDASAWEDSWTIWFKEVVDKLEYWNEQSFGNAGLIIPKHYWATHAYWGRKRIFVEGKELCDHVRENYFYTFPRALPHPILRKENLNGIAPIRKLDYDLSSPRMNMLGLQAEEEDDAPIFDEERLKVIRDAEYRQEIEYQQRLRDQAEDLRRAEDNKGKGLFVKFFG